MDVEDASKEIDKGTSSSRDDALLRVLLDINTSLQRLEERLAPPAVANPPRNETGNLKVTTQLERTNDETQNIVPVGKSSTSKSQRVGRFQPPETKYYEISQEYRRRMINAGFGYSTRLLENESKALITDFPAFTSDPGWNYYKPVWVESSELVEQGRGNGKSNFIGAWDLDIENDVERVFSAAEESSEDVWLEVPYFATPPIDINDQHLGPKYGRALTTLERYNLIDLLGGLWTAPPDWRLNLNFQQHMLRAQKQPIIPYATMFRDQLLELDRIGGSFEIADAEEKGDFYIYGLKKSATAAQVEEFRAAFPTLALRVTKNGFPKDLQQLIEPPILKWNRLIRIYQLADVFEESPWQFGEDMAEDLPFDLHTTCSLKANERLVGEDPSIFHISWINIQNTSREDRSSHAAWTRYPLHGSLKRSPETMGKVCGTVQSFSSIKNRAASLLYPERFKLKKECWTILALLPEKDHENTKVKYEQSLRGEAREHYNLWVMMLCHIHYLLEMASQSWFDIGGVFEQMLAENFAMEMLAEDDKFSESQKLFWIINQIDSILPMIMDATTQWDWYMEANGLRLGPSDLYNILFFGTNKKEEDLSALQHDTLREFRRYVAAIQVLIRRLENSQRGFEAVRERARSLRDGLFALTSVKEAREARQLGENVKLLTYVTIFYLPLTFCTSMWAIKDMFGTGTRGFAIITTVIAVATYAVVFWLLHPSAPKIALIDLLKPFTREDRKVNEVTDAGTKQPATRTSTKGKGKEKGGILFGDEELQRNFSSENDYVQVPKKKFFARFRKK